MSVPTQIGTVLVELIQYPGDDQVQVALMEPGDGCAYLMVPLSTVMAIPTGVLRVLAHHPGWAVVDTQPPAAPLLTAGQQWRAGDPR